MSIQQIDTSSSPYQILDPEGNLVGEMPKLVGKDGLKLIQREIAQSAHPQHNLALAKPRRKVQRGNQSFVPDDRAGKQ